jgi:hypothetical protein
MKSEIQSKRIFGIVIYVVTIIIALVGITAYETVRTCEAQVLGYDQVCFDWGFGQVFFSNAELDSIVIQMKRTNYEAIVSGADFSEKVEWEALKAQDKKNHAFIELSGYIFSVCVSLIGLVILISRRKKHNEQFAVLDWVGVFLSLFIVKEVVFSLVRVALGFTLCEHAALANQFNLPVMGFEWFWVIVGSAFTSFVLIRFVPRTKLIPFVLGCILGSMTAGGIWLFILGKIVFSAC